MFWSKNRPFSTIFGELAPVFERFHISNAFFIRYNLLSTPQTLYQSFPRPTARFRAPTPFFEPTHSFQPPLPISKPFHALSTPFHAFLRVIHHCRPSTTPTSRSDTPTITVNYLLPLHSFLTNFQPFSTFFNHFLLVPAVLFFILKSYFIPLVFLTVFETLRPFSSPTAHFWLIFAYFWLFLTAFTPISTV